MYVIELLLNYPGAGALHPDILEQLLNPVPDIQTPEQEIAALLTQRHHPIYADVYAISQDLVWLEQNGLIHQHLSPQAVHYGPLKQAAFVGEHDSQTYHRYGDWPIFERLFTVIRYIFHHPLLPKQEGQRISETLITQIKRESFNYMTTHDFRRDVQLALRPYGLLSEPTYKQGYFAGTALLTRDELRQIHRALSASAQTLRNPLDQSIYEQFTTRLEQANVMEVPYPVRWIANRVIVETNADNPALPLDNLFRHLAFLEECISQGIPLEFGFRTDSPTWDRAKQLFRVWPLQIVYRNIAWYLAYERQDNGLFFLERIDRLFLAREVGGGRGEKTQRQALHKLQELLQASAFIYLGNNPGVQGRYLNPHTRTQVEVSFEVHFSESLVPFIREGIYRFPKLILGSSTDSAFPLRLQAIFPQWSIQDIELQRWILGYGREIRVITPDSLLQRIRAIYEP